MHIGLACTVASSDAPTKHDCLRSHSSMSAVHNPDDSGCCQMFCILPVVMMACKAPSLWSFAMAFLRCCTQQTVASGYQRQESLAQSVSSKSGCMLQGVYCGKQPYKVIVMCVLAIGVCCLGLLRFQVETDPQRLWVGSASLAAREKAQYEVNPISLVFHCSVLLQRRCKHF